MIKYNIDTEYTKGYRYKLYPIEEQIQFIDKCINTNRYVYNWALNLENEAYEKGEPFLTIVDLYSKLTIHRNETPWLQEIPNTTCRSGIIDLINGYNRFFKKISNKPQFKSKNKERKHSFHTRNDRIYFNNTKIKIEGCDYIETKINMDRFKNLKIHNPVISRDNLGDYYISFTVVEEKPKDLQDIPKSEVIGIDLNKYNYFALSNGKIYKAPEEKIRRLQKGISDAQIKCTEDRKRHNELEKTNPDNEIPMSKRSQKRKERYLKRHKKLTNVVENTIHNITKEIVMTNPAGVVMEGFDVNRLKSKHYIADDIHNYSFGKCREIMKSNCNKYNIPFKLAPENFKSSKICSNCGYIKENMTCNKKFICPKCGYKEDRDINAAKNLAKIFDEI